MLRFCAGFQLPLKRFLQFAPLRNHSRRLHGNTRKRLALPLTHTVKRFECCLETCTDIRLLRKVHASILTHGLGGSISIGSKLWNVYANFGCLPKSIRMSHTIASKQISPWNSAIINYFRSGHFEEALLLYLNLKSEGINIDSAAINFVLKCCIELMHLHFGRSIHADALKTGLNSNMFVGSSLIGVYFGSGTIKDAEGAFEEISEKDVVTYTSMVSGYSRFTDFNAWRAFDIVTKMHNEGLDANRVTLVSLLQAAAHLQALKEGRSIHCYAFRRGMGFSDEVFLTSLVDMYAKCGASAAAACALRQMKRRNVASWNALIAGLSRSGQISESLKYFNLMQQDDDVCPDSVTLANVLSACSNFNFKKYTTSLHAYIMRRNIFLDEVLTTSLVELYSKFNKMIQARKLFENISFRDVVCYNVMINGYLQDGKIEDAINIFSEMNQAGTRPNSATMVNFLSAFTDIEDERNGKCVHGIAVRHGLWLDLDLSNMIMHMYVRCGQINSARLIFDLMGHKDLISWTTMMQGYVNYGLGEEAAALFVQIQGTGSQPDSLTIMTLLQAYAQLGNLESVKAIHGYMYRSCMEEDITTINSLIITYAKCGRLDIAESVFGSIFTEPGLTSWNTMIAAYGIHGYCKDVLKMFDQMQRKNVKPDALTFSSVISACSHSGLVEEAWHIFHSMKDHSVSPQEEHYNCMIDLLGRAGQLEEAFALLKHSPMRDKAAGMCSLLAACKNHKNSEIGEAIGAELLELEPHNSRTYALMSNVYAQVGKWSEAAYLWTIARKRGLSKAPGYSFVELSKNVSAI
ncbi:pentatricopeptide repeat-containing protein At1g06140, mitochondrial-like [Zingiber officinale]|uniref:pentatricopeptide repeat-containing protein At1g06140, mitochondrial-like n=1 Tax=Zingiber officinale TaxID=94328 RepID=UPI001C4C1303|nr:pentatricopeptide repeat-containing protein At1g06140, mitochondrial-like [Zingiber officinale]XP_042441931.1 pentatricopeptide repeat-containing protein At1g06140, mitochondrial-like [Zingiber officinale]XP_042441932.1 pentatricopeptide repeat-containing protein At1g06140, mitochondrial-like [Zingiber officinale]XP_042441933.1 pentatricopeptide repeat-containing protein At1g06140, mitochondrial-like [Zingiber officinale]XP_042441934.1 pentatricopeptide repeat-containing protein At1g06140, m